MKESLSLSSAIPTDLEYGLTKYVRPKFKLRSCAVAVILLPFFQRPIRVSHCVSFMFIEFIANIHLKSLLRIALYDGMNQINLFIMCKLIN